MDINLPECNWDDMGSCKECQKKRCANCAGDEVCPTCEEKLGTSACYALCTDDINVCRGQVSLDFGLWKEMYAATRCLRDRYVSKRDQFMFPGFCKQHNQLQQQFVDAYWNKLEQWQKLLLTYMIDGNKCSLQNFDYFLFENAELYKNVQTEQIVNLVLSPAGILAVNHIYLQTFIDLRIQQSLLVGDVVEEFLRMVSNINTEEDKDLLMEQTRQKMATTHDYSFVARGILQQETIDWLCEKEVERCIRLMRWNQLLYKINMAFIFSFFPNTFRSNILRFSSEWKTVWDNEAKMYEGNPIFVEHWGDFMTNVEAMVMVIEESFQKITIPDERPFMDIGYYSAIIGECVKPREDHL